MPTTRGLRWGGLAGLGFAAGIALQNGVLLWGAPLPSATLAEVEAFYAGRAAQVALACAWVAVNTPLLLVFVAAVAGAAGERGEGGLWARVATIGAAATVALFGGATALQALLVARAPQLAASPTLLQLAWDLHSAAFGVVGIALGALVAALALAARAGGLAPRGLAAVGLASGALLLAGGAGTASIVQGGPALWLTMSGFVLWIAFLVSVSWRLLAAARGTDARPVEEPAIA